MREWLSLIFGFPIPGIFLVFNFGDPEYLGKELLRKDKEAPKSYTAPEGALG